MFYRTTAQSNSQTAIRFAAQYNQQITNYQLHLTSGVRLHRPSDDPIAFRQANALTTQLGQLENDTSTISDISLKLNSSSSLLQSSSELISRASALGQQGIQASSQAERNALAVEVEGLFSSLKNIALTQTGGTYLYSGTRTKQPPYEFSEPEVAGATLNAQYLGSRENSQSHIGSATSVDTYYSGDQIFANKNRQDVVVIGTTGAKNGAGTDNMIGRATLLVKHSVTNYEAGSGIQAGVSSADKDTVLGQLGDNELTIADTSGTGDFGTVQLNNGDVVQWQRSDDDLVVSDSNGRKLFLDTGSITAGFNGTVQFSSDGTLSVDGGLTEVAIDFSSSQTVTDSTSATQTHIDTREIKQVGDDSLEFPGTSNLFQVFHELISDLRNDRGLDNVGAAESLERRLSELGEYSNQVLDVLGQQSASAQSLQEVEIRVQTLQLEVETQISNIQGTDIPETVLRLRNEQTLLEFTYAVSAQIASSTILDFLR
jgi:flagellin-like hook-associated protein FlgL